MACLRLPCASSQAQAGGRRRRGEPEEYMKAHLPRALDSSWTTLVRTGDDMAYLEYTALTVGAVDLLHCSFQPVFDAWCIENCPQGRKRSMGTYDVLGLV